MVNIINCSSYGSKGFSFDWNILYKDQIPERISAPTYPFAKERYWLDVNDSKVSKAHTHSILHPLLHENISGISCLKYKSLFTGEEFFLKDHLVQSNHTLPNIADLEIVNQAFRKALDDFDDATQVIELKNILWAKPITFQANKESLVSISLYPKDSGDFGFELSTNKVINSQGMANLINLSYLKKTFKTKGIAYQVELDNLKGKYNESSFNKADFYQKFKSAGLQYGVSYQAINSLLSNKDSSELLSEIIMPEGIVKDFGLYILHPSIMGAVLQSAMLLHSNLLESSEYTIMAFPYYLDNLYVLSASAKTMYAEIKFQKNKKKRRSK